MAGYDQKIKVAAKYASSTKDFFRFLQAVGRKYQEPVKVAYRYLGRGYFYITVSGPSGSIDSLFQELVLNKGLYYYACSVKNNRQEVISRSIVPVFQQLLENRFQNPYSRFLRRHILGKISNFMPGDMSNVFSHKYEILFRKWDTEITDDWNFIKDLDSLLTEFMLKQIGHKVGHKSPNFSKLLEIAQKRGIGMMDEIKDFFKKIHTERTTGLHRLQINLTRDELSTLAFATYNYFQFFDDFSNSQNEKTTKLHGKRYARIKYGSEKRPDEEGSEEEWNKITEQPCHDCAAIRGQFHCEGCDVEECPRCLGQYLGCSCKLKKDYD